MTSLCVIFSIMSQCPEAIHPGEREVLMRRTTYYVFHSATAPDLRGLTGDLDGTRLPASDGPWTLERQINPDEPWPLDGNEAVVEFGSWRTAFTSGDPLPSPPHPSLSLRATVLRARRCSTFRGTGSAPSSGC